MQMFFIMGITHVRKSFDYDKMIVCEHCDSYGRYQSVRGKTPYVCANDGKIS